MDAFLSFCLNFLNKTFALPPFPCSWELQGLFPFPWRRWRCSANCQWFQPTLPALLLSVTAAMGGWWRKECRLAEGGALGHLSGLPRSSGSLVVTLDFLLAVSCYLGQSHRNQQLPIQGHSGEFMPLLGRVEPIVFCSPSDAHPQAPE